MLIGSNVTRLSNNNASDESPSWSPDGERIAFVSDRAFQDSEGLNRNHEIYVMNCGDGSEQTRLTEESEDDFNPRWSPDGEKIAFVSSRDAGDESDDNAIYIMNSAGDDGSSNVTRLTDPDSYYTDLDWGRNTSSPGGGNGGGGGSTPTTPRPQQIIDEAITNIENLDNSSKPKNKRHSTLEASIR
jgi:Tol biopolymer transport system component